MQIGIINYDIRRLRDANSSTLCDFACLNTVNDIFQVKNPRHEGGPEYRDLRNKQLPLEHMDGKMILPLAGTTKSEKTVVLVQVNVTKGGIIMALCLHHSSR